jgi:hypothetical protein
MKALPLFLSLILQMNALCQELTEGFKVIHVNKMIKEFPDSFSMSSPLQTYLSLQNFLIKNDPNYSIWGIVNVERYRSGAPSFSYSENEKKQVLNTRIVEVNYYNDSVATVISQVRDSHFNCRWFEFDKNKWYSCGDDNYDTYEGAHLQFTSYAQFHLNILRQVNSFEIIPKDTLSFLSFLASEAKDPKEMVLQTLSSHKVVAYGEIHRRLLSWNFCRSLLNDPRFCKSAGTVFMEISAHSQKNLDQFLASKTCNKELILETFQDMTQNGWNDKGMFDFIMDVWKVNQNLEDDKRIKIVAIDIPRPYNTFLKREDIDNYFSKIERDSFMAQTIQNYLLKKKDKRNSFFIVGAAHLSKTASNAGGILSRGLPKDDFYTYFTHCPRTPNNGPIQGKIRHGVFDYVFSKTGNKPLAFNLLYSPFGKEPFDGLVGVGSGTYSDNYDGYIFLGPLDEEPNGETLYELYNDAFVKELDRRYHLYNSSLKDDWGLKDSSKEALITWMKETKNTLRWGKITNN